MGLGWTEILVIAAIGLLFFGRGRVSDFMGDLAKGIKNFKKGLSEEENPASPASDITPPKKDS